MAIGIGSIVAVKISSAALTEGFVCAQPPCFGVSETAATPFTVTWQPDGSRVAAVPDSSLDEITTPGNTTAALLGKLVTIAGYDASYTSVVVGAYKRTAVDYVLLKSVATGAWREIIATAVTVTSG